MTETALLIKQLFVLDFLLATNSHEQVKLLAEVDRMIDLEKERLEVDRRDAQIQRAQLAFKLLGSQGT